MIWLCHLFCSWPAWQNIYQAPNSLFCQVVVLEMCHSDMLNGEGSDKHNSIGVVVISKVKMEHVNVFDGRPLIYTEFMII